MMKRPAILLFALLLAVPVTARVASAQGRAVRESDVRATEMVLAADSTLGLLIGTPAAIRVAI